MPTSTWDHFKARIDRFVGGVLIVLMGGSVVNVLWQVFTRFVVGSPSGFTEELARYLLIWVGVLGAGYVVGRKAHLALELLPEQLEGRRAVLLDGLIQATVAVFALTVMVWGGGRLVYIQLTLGQTSPALGISLGLVYGVIPFSGLLMTFYVAVHLAAARRRWRAAGTRQTDATGAAGKQKALSAD